MDHKSVIIILFFNSYAINSDIDYSASKNKNKLLKTKHRKQKFTKKWVSDPELSTWLSHDQNNIEQNAYIATIQWVQIYTII